ncbi:MAG: 1-phosphofructokinase family hexose kinase [Nitrospirota bacterium]
MSLIVTLTMNPAIDKSSSIDHVVAEKKLRCKTPSHYPGGGGVNVSRALKELGMSSGAVYPSGGPAGKLLDTLLEKIGIDCHPVKMKNWTRENLTIFEKASEKQYRFGMPGAKLSRKEYQQCVDRIFSFQSHPDYIIASGSLPPGVPNDFYARLAQKVRKNGSRMILDTSGKALHLAVKTGVYLIKPNMNELEFLADKKISDEWHQEEVARNVIRKCRCEIIVVSLGAAGALLVTAKETTRLRAPSVPVKSKVGAGDSMVAGMVFGLVKGYSLQNAVRYGIAAGAAAVMTTGTELCRRQDVAHLYKFIKVDNSLL